MISVELFTSRTVFLSIGTVQVYWYGLLYVIAFWSAWFFLPLLGNMRGIILSRDAWTSIVAYGALGVLVGGRLGYVFFYEPTFFLADPLEILQIWHGGMSSHGGFVGAALFVWLSVRKKSVPLLALADTISPVAALGLGLGRVGNVINEEFGVFAMSEALGDVVLAIVCFVLLMYTKRNGVVFGVFLGWYGVQRFLLEYVRVQEWPLFMGISRGQFLTIPLLIVAVLVLHRAYKR